MSSHIHTASILLSLYSNIHTKRHGIIPWLLRGLSLESLCALCWTNFTLEMHGEWGLRDIDKHLVLKEEIVIRFSGEKELQNFIWAVCFAWRLYIPLPNFVSNTQKEWSNLILIKTEWQKLPAVDWLHQREEKMWSDGQSCSFRSPSN
jgi:hypothetical protein